MVVGVTGGIGSGKSVVCNIFRQFGIPVYEADVEAKKLYDLPEVIEEVKKTLGKKVFSADGVLDKNKLADMVFSDSKALNKINEIIHPFVKRQFKEWKKQYRALPYLIKEAAILFESGSDKGCDKIITVTAPLELRIQRVVDRDNRSKEQVEKIVSRQWTDEEKIKRSDFVVINDEKKIILPQVLKIHEQLLAIVASQTQTSTLKP